MFIDFINQIFEGCTTPAEYILALLLFYMIMDFIVLLVSRLLSFGRR